MVKGVRFVLAVPDAEATAAWWRDVMGFAIELEIEGWRFVRRGACRIMLGACPHDASPASLGSHSYFGYVEVDDLDGYFAQIAARGADVPAPPADRPWGMREMAVRTPDGHRVMFAQAL
ncbi:VOC family protein [Caulobacter sp. 17J65-9]|uniref:VOC family protein n=1 Tax=Caulobacter sp. 17J65-9 TaxID=2709382 RepID=UPI0013C5E7F5|nr:VOC family protein [Caulobacter sp. 17J65-9]NEX94128.1 bleomycin resistance family protein [Caulobacter sp. 17J65-9]